GGWRWLDDDPGFGGLTSAQAMMTDSAGRVWLGQGDTIIRVEQGVPRNLAGLSARLRVGAVLAFAEHPGRLWIGGVEGLAMLDGERAHTLKVRDGVAFNRVSGVVETPDGDLWVRGADDLWRIPAAELRQALAENRSDVAVEHFDALDGLG